jgi:hypothetical protein
MFRNRLLACLTVIVALGSSGCDIVSHAAADHSVPEVGTPPTERPGSMTTLVLWQGNAAYIYYDVGLEPEARFYAILRRLREAGLTIVQGSEVVEVPPSSSIAAMVAAQNLEQGE